MARSNNAEDLSFLPDKVTPVIDEDLSFLPDKTEDLSFLPDKNKPLNIQPSINAAVQPFQSALSAIQQPAVDLVNPVTQIAEGIKPSVNAAISNMGDVLSTTGKVVSGQPEAISNTLTKWERGPDIAANKINEELYKAYPYKENPGVTNPIEAATKMLTQFAGTVAGNPEDVMKTGQMIAPAVLMQAKPSMIGGTLLGGAITSLAKKGILNNAISVMEKKMLEAGYPVNDIAKISNMVKSRVKAVEPAITPENAIKLNVGTRRANIPNYFEPSQSTTKPLLPEPTPQSPTAQPVEATTPIPAPNTALATPEPKVPEIAQNHKVVGIDADTGLKIVKMTPEGQGQVAPTLEHQKSVAPLSVPLGSTPNDLKSDLLSKPDYKSSRPDEISLEPAPSAPAKGTILEPKEPSTTESPLMQEARKYKTAEEWIKAVTEDSGGVGYPDYAPAKRLIETEINDTPLTNYGFKPKEKVTIYRGVDNASQKDIVAGDYIATSYDLAKSYTGKEVISKEVPASSVRFSSGDGITVKDFSKGFNNSHLEGVYNPTPLIPKSQLTDIWNKAHTEAKPTPQSKIAELKQAKLSKAKSAQEQVLNNPKFVPKGKIFNKPKAGGIFHQSDAKVADYIKKNNLQHDISKPMEIVRMDKDTIIKDVHGVSHTLKAGEEIRQYPLTNNKVLVQDGVRFITTEGKADNIEQGGLKLGEQKPFGEEFKGLEETVKGKQIVSKRERYLRDRQESGALTSEEQLELANANLANNTGTKFTQWTLPGGENQREINIIAPLNGEEILTSKGYKINKTEKGYAVTTPSGSVVDKWATKEQAINAFIRNVPNYQSPSSHSYGDKSDRNRISMLRMNDRKTPNNEPVSFIEEIQSDWAREGREKGFESKNVDIEQSDLMKTIDRLVELYPVEKRPVGIQNEINVLGEKWNTLEDAKKSGIPFHPSLKNWQELTLKRALKEAVDSGSKYLSWVTGEQTADRYDLAKQVDEVKLVPDSNFADKSGKQWRLQAYKGDKTLISKAVNDSEIGDYIGKDKAKKILEMQPDENGIKTLSGIDLQVGGEWASNLYDRQIPSILEKMTKKYGGRIVEIDLKGTQTKYRLSQSGRQNPDGSWQWAVIDNESGTAKQFYKTKELAQKALNVYEDKKGLKQPALLITPVLKQWVKGQSIAPFAGGKMPAKAKTGEEGYVNISELPKLVELLKKYFTRTQGLSKQIDILNDQRIGKILEPAFDAPLTGKEIRKYIDKYPSETTNEVIYNYLTGQGDISLIPKEIQNPAEKMRNDIDRLSKTLVDNGASKETTLIVIKNNIGKYLTRAYRLFEDKHYEPTPAVIEKAKAKLREMHPNTIGKLSSDEMDGIIKSILDKSNVRLFRGEKKPVNIPQNHFVRRKNIPQELRDLYGEIRDPVWLYLKTVSHSAATAYNAEFLNKISAIEGLYADTPNGKQFKKLPDTASWGNLKGKYVDENLHSFLIEQLDPTTGAVFRAIEKLIVNPFKWSKTVANMPSHPRNFLGNTMFSILADNNILNPFNTPHYVKAAKIILNKDTSGKEEWKGLIRRRVVESQYWGSEMPKMMDDILKIDPPTFADKAYDLLVKKPINFLGAMYNYEDAIYRIASDLKNQSKGISPEESAIMLDKYFTNYSKVPLVTKIGRKIAFLGPFMSFKSEVVRIIYNSAKESVKQTAKGNPLPALKLVLALGVPTILSAIAKEVFDVDKEEVKKFEKVLPSYRRGGTLIYFRNKEGKLKAFDLTYIWPTGDFERAIKSLSKGDIDSFSDSMNLFAHPIFDAWSIVIGNTDPYTHKPIANQYDPLASQMLDKAKAFLKATYLPGSSPIPDLGALGKGEIKPGSLTGYSFENIINAYNGISDRYGRTKDLPEEIKNFLTGVRTWQIYPNVVLQNYIRGKSYDIRNERQELASWMKKNNMASQPAKQSRIQTARKRILKIQEDISEASQVKIKLLEN